jgi:hypothetical protein
MAEMIAADSRPGMIPAILSTTMYTKKGANPSKVSMRMGFYINGIR